MLFPNGKNYLKLFRPPVNAFILVSSDPCVDTLSKGNPFSGGFKYTGGGKNWSFFSTDIAVYLGNGAR